jgi:hypothetical protein
VTVDSASVLMWIQMVCRLRSPAQLINRYTSDAGYRASRRGRLRGTAVVTHGCRQPARFAGNSQELPSRFRSETLPETLPSAQAVWAIIA